VHDVYLIESISDPGRRSISMTAGSGWAILPAWESYAGKPSARDSRMVKLLVMAALACQPGYRLFDIRGHLSPSAKVAEFIISVSPFYTRLTIYPVGHPEDLQRCCNNKPVSTVVFPIGNGQFCIKQSQPQMKWKLRLAARPDVEL
jgi:hypothetical protein